MVLDAAEEFTKSSDIDYIRIDGSTKITERQQFVELFQASEQVRVAILAITACSVGLTLTAASHVVFGEMYFTPATMVQAEDRTHRIGQTDPNVTVHYLYGRNTLDCLIYGSLQTKFAVCEKTLDRTNDGMQVENVDSLEVIDLLTNLLDEEENELSKKKKKVNTEIEEKSY